MLNKFRKSLQPILEKIGVLFSSTGLSPNTLSLIGFLITLISSIVFVGEPKFSLFSLLEIFPGPQCSKLFLFDSKMINLHIETDDFLFRNYTPRLQTTAHLFTKT